MPQWGKIDRANNAPIWAPALMNKAVSTTTRDAMFGNTTSGAYIANAEVAVYGVDANENAYANGQVTSVSVLTAGSGFTARPTATLSGGGGTGTTLNVTAKVVSVVVVDGGVDYAAADVLTINATGAAGGTATANVNVLTVDANGAILTVSVNTAGSFITLPTLVANNDASGGNGTSALLTLSFGVNTVTPIANGSAYTTAPTVTIGGAGGTGATARATVAGSAATRTRNVGWVLRKRLPNGREQVETLVAMKAITSDASDDAVFPEPA